MESKFKKVMIVDDNEIDNYLVKSLIRSSNIAEEVVEFDNGFDAIEYLDQHKDSGKHIPDLILLDIYMPKMNGIQFLENFNKIEFKYPDKCKVCVVSSSINDNDIYKTKLSDKVIKYTTKPVTEEFLRGL